MLGNCWLAGWRFLHLHGQKIKSGCGVCVSTHPFLVAIVYLVSFFNIILFGFVGLFCLLCAGCGVFFMKGWIWDMGYGWYMVYDDMTRITNLMI